MPRAKPVSVDDEENEKTTIESQWEEEASTTVEQGDVAEKIRALGVEPQLRTPARTITNVTNTGASALDEPTVDDQHRPQLTGLSRPHLARLLITQGNEVGQTLEIVPGKSYTVGRGIDNDLVLTDIAVSRKHFDLRHENGTWVIADRGSGNGTVVNGAIEDNPFVLASGDAIEIGNTQFRFEYPNGAPRAREGGKFDDDDELSTVAGKPLRGTTQANEERPPPAGSSPPPPRFERPKTLPPPTPLRSRAPSSAPLQPPPILAPPIAAPPLAPQPASTLPMPQMAPMASMTNRPMLAPQAPTMLGDVLSQPLASPIGSQPLPQQTLQGQNMPPPGARPLYYPQASELPPQSVGVHAHMLVMPQNAPRGDGSTMHVPPTPYSNGMVVAQPMRFGGPRVSRRTKMALAGGALALTAAIATVAIIQATSKDPKPAANGSASAKGAIVEPITPTPAPSAGSGSASSFLSTPNGKTNGTVAVAKTDSTKTDALKTDTTKTDSTKTDSSRTDATKVDTARTDSTRTNPIKTDSAKTDSAKTDSARTDTARTDTSKTDSAKTDTARTDTRATTTSRTDTRRTDTRATTTSRTDTRRTETRPDTSRTTTARVATVDTSDIRAKADDLYQKRKFSEAASLLNSAARNVPESEAQKLKYTASIYDKLGRALAVGTAPATKSTDAYKSLQAAQNYDGVVGGKFSDEIRTKLGQAAAKATIQFMALKDYESAHLAVIIAEKSGNSSDNTRIAKQSLERVAADLYNQAQSEMSSDPAGAKDKARRITRIVDSSSSWYGKAQKLLGK